MARRSKKKPVDIFEVAMDDHDDDITVSNHEEKPIQSDVSDVVLKSIKSTGNIYYPGLEVDEELYLKFVNFQAIQNLIKITNSKITSEHDKEMFENGLDIGAKIAYLYAVNLLY